MRTPSLVPALVLAAAVACSGSEFAGSGGAKTNGPKPETDGKTDDEADVVIPVGDSEPLEDIPGIDSDKPIASSESSDPKVAVFDEDTGAIVGKSPGTATITIVYEDGSVATIEVRVTDQDDQGGGSVGETDTTGVVGPQALDDTGIVKEECREVETLPESTLSLVELFHWQASGDKAAFTQIASTPIVGKLKRTDKAPTVLVAAFATCVGDVSQPSHLFAIDGRTGAQKWVSSFQVRSWLSPALADLDGDGASEVVVLGMDGYLHALDASGAKVWTSSTKAHTTSAAVWPTGVAIADITGDGKAEVTMGGHVFRGKDGSHLYSIADLGGFTIVAETDGKPGLEVVSQKGIYDGKTGKAICAFPTAIQDPAAGRLGKGDKTATIVGIAGEQVLLFDGATCAQKAAIAKPQKGGGPINIADFDGDGVLDIGAAGFDWYMAFSGKGSVLWTARVQDHSSSVTGSTTFDFNGDGENEIVYADEIKVRILEGRTGRLLYEAPHNSYTARETPVIVDVNGDGVANVVVGANTCLPGATLKGLRAFKEPRNAWVGTRTIWNQHGYDPLLVMASGKVTGVDTDAIVKPWLASPHLAGFRNNIPKVRLKKECR